MDSKDKTNENIAIIKEQIDKFDNKANILITIVGIIFAISLSVLDIFRVFKSITASYILLLIFTSLYFISFGLEMIFLIMVIYPRQKKNKDKKSLSYYLDVSTMTDEEIRTCLESKDCSSEIDQLKNNANICSRKHKLLVKAIWTLIPLFVFVIAMFFIVLI